MQDSPLMPPAGSILWMVREINRRVLAKMAPETIRAEVHAAVCEVAPEIPSAVLARMLDRAYDDALPLSPRHARARLRRKAWKKGVTALPECHRSPVQAVGLGGHAEERLSLLRQLRRRGEAGLLVSVVGFPPFRPHGERLVRDGLATTSRKRLCWAKTAKALHITPEGLKVLARMEREIARRTRKYP